MIDLEQRQVPVYASDLYLELQRIEERGERMRKQRKSWIAAILALGRSKNTGAAETA